MADGPDLRALVGEETDEGRIRETLSGIIFGQSVFNAQVRLNSLRALAERGMSDDDLLRVLGDDASERMRAEAATQLCRRGWTLTGLGEWYNVRHENFEPEEFFFYKGKFYLTAR